MLAYENGSFKISTNSIHVCLLKNYPPYQDNSLL